MSKYKFKPNERYALLEVHDWKCYQCSTPIVLNTMQVDHLIPESILLDMDELARIIKYYSLPTDFNINSYENWAPMCPTCNSKKKDTKMRQSEALLFRFEELAKKAMKARKIEARLNREKELDQQMISLLDSIFSNEINLLDVIRTLNAFLDADKILRIDNSMIGSVKTLVGNQWKPIDVDSQGLVIVSNGVQNGLTPDIDHTTIHWMCPTCGEYGPWNGCQCLSCGHFSYND